MNTWPTKPADGQRVALVTGGSSGIGLAAAQALAERGYAVVVVARDHQRLEQARTQIATTTSIPTMTVAADVSNPAGVDRVMDAITQQWGRLDVVFANAGGPDHKALLDIGSDDFDAVIGANIKSVFFTVIRALPLLTRGGSVVVTSSVAQSKGRPGDPLYSASKAAVRSLVRTLALHDEVLARAVRINAVTPGTIATSLTTGLDAHVQADVDEYVTTSVPMARWGTAQEVAHAVLFLAGEDASYITGSEIVIDGGLSQA